MESLGQRHDSYQGEMKNQSITGFFSYINKAISHFSHFTEGKEEEMDGQEISGEAYLTNILVARVETARREQLSCSHILYLSLRLVYPLGVEGLVQQALMSKKWM